nr:hypothetical protein [Tanacetum cinerariifolium]
MRWGQGHMGRSGEGLGTVPVWWGCTGMAGEEGRFWAGKFVKELVPELWVFDKLNFTVRLFNEKLLPGLAFLCGF